MAEQAAKGWHSRARKMWRDGFSDPEIATAFGVTKSAVMRALAIPRIVEGDAEKGSRGSAGMTRVTARSRANKAATDELDCVSMMEALQRGAVGSRRFLRRYAGEVE